jgi:glycosyltransferase involved in cell wall biosynthesis
MRSVAILYKSLPAYRLEFFDQLRTSLAADGVEVHLYHGDAVGADASKGDARSLPWSSFQANKVVTVRGRPLVWQPVLRSALSHDLVIVEQASKLLINYPLLLTSKLPKGPRLALWGHGANLQIHTASRFSEALKRRYSRLPHWWFAYTEGSKARVARLGYPTERITVVQNAVDTASLQRQVDDLAGDEVDEFRHHHNLTPGHVGLFLGSLYPEKRLDFLLEAARSARDLDPLFSLLIGGDGPSRADLEAAASSLPFVHCLGRVDGTARALALRASDLMLMPGLVGLGILDAFAAGTPLITTAVDFHSPEIEYLQDGHNGLMLPRETSPMLFGHEVASLLSESDRLEQMVEACRRDALRYSTSEMVDRFRIGVLHALEAS